MNTDNENNIKELELGKDTTSKEIKKDSTGEAIINDKPSNSFYDGGSNDSDTKWTQDWRGKSLFLFLAFLIVLAVTIPSGMAIAGYFKDELETPDFSAYEPSEKVKRDIQYLKNEAIVDHFEQMYQEGWFTKRFYDNKVEDIENDADSTITDEKDALKKEFGNTWETEWNKSLDEKGFDSEDAYRASILATSYEKEQSQKYTSQTFLKGSSYDASLDVAFKSNPTDSGRVSYINNDETIKSELVARNEDSEDVTISPEDLMKGYIYFYQPVAFNSSIIPFVPNDATGTASINMSTVTLTKENIIDMWHFLRAAEGGTYQTQTSVEGSIQSRSNINISVGANAAIYAAASGGTMTDGNIAGAIGAITTASGAALSSSTTLSDINAMNTSQVDAASTAFATALQSTYAATSDRGYVFKETIETAHPVNYPAGDDVTYYSYMDVDGIHMIGLQDYANATLESDGTLTIDATMVTNYLDSINESGNYQYIPDEGLVSSYTSWVSSNLDNIILFDYINRETELVQEHIETAEISVEDYVNAFKYYLENKVISNFNTRYYEVADFYSTNRKVYDYEAFKKDVAYKDAFLNYNLAQNLDSIVGIVDGILSSTKTEILIRGGDDNE